MLVHACGAFEHAKNDALVRQSDFADEDTDDQSE